MSAHSMSAFLRGLTTERVKGSFRCMPMTYCGKGHSFSINQSLAKSVTNLRSKVLSSFPCRSLDIDINKLENAGFCVDLRHYSDCFSKISVADSQKDYLESFATIKQYKFASKQLGKKLWVSKQTVSILSFTVADFLT